MTREAKIGMLTGLGVIVLIGVLLSEYLGGGAHPGVMSPTGRMAELPMGAAYRQEIMQPVGVPGLARTDAPGAGGPAGAPVAAIPAGSPTMPVPAFATDASGAPRMEGGAAPAANGPTINQPVAPVPAGNVQLNTPVTNSLPTMQLPPNAQNVQAVYVPGQMTPTGNSADAPAAENAKPQPLKVEGTEYTIAPGDNLAKIARKFYKSSKPSDIQRIVDANASLKTDKSMLIAGRKLIIPTAPAAADTPAETTAPVAQAPSTHKQQRVVIHQPGEKKEMAESSPELTGPTHKESAKTYVVQSGDTLEKIAKKFPAGSVSETVKKIMAANGIKDPKSLKVGEKLKLPAQAA